jgi:CRISPR-associated protein Csd2
MNHRYEFVYLFDVKDGNPNGDPDAGNLPRMDPETGHGLVTDVCLKRKIRNFVMLMDDPNLRRQIFVQERRPLNPLIAEAASENDLPTFEKKGKSWNTDKSKKRPKEEIETMQQWLCRRYFDIRTFGAVLSTGPNGGQIRGPIQLGMARSLDPIFYHDHAITRVADVDKEEGEMGRKSTVPYGLYRVHGFINPALAEKTGFDSEEKQTAGDLDLFWTALEQMFEHDRSASRGEMSPRALFVFEHESKLGNAPAHKLFERITVQRNESLNGSPARSFSDYVVNVDEKDLPSGVNLTQRF